MPDYLWNAEESVLRRTLLSPLLLAEGPYRVGAWLNRKSYEWKLRRRGELGARVISVGNLAVGGSGKTPMVGWLARELHARGRKVAILSRGVRGRRIGEVNVVSDGDRVLLAPADVGDEPVMLAGRVPGVPVLAGRNRRALGLRAEAAFGAEILILDDGFQHHRLARDLDLVCIDAALGLGNGHVLPRGPLREPASALQHADAILWTHASEGDGPPRHVGSVPARAAQFRIAIAPRGLRSSGARELQPLERLRGERVGLLAAIARPDRLAADITNLGARVAARRVFGDHHRYRRADLEGLDDSLLWVTTAKDAVKIPESWAPTRLLVLEQGVRPLDGAALIEFVTRQLDAGGAR